jgi:hypothetical protein
MLSFIERSFLMSKFNSPLNNIHIASPCSADWNEMYGDNRKRFCGDCKLNVFNLSGMTRDEAEALIMNSEGRLCVKFYKRADGSVITKDCPVGWAKVKHRTRVMATAALSLIMSILSGVFFVSLFSTQKNVVGWLKVPFVNTTPMGVMGNFAIPPNTNTKPETQPDANMIMGGMNSIKVRPVRSDKPGQQIPRRGQTDHK